MNMPSNSQTMTALITFYYSAGKKTKAFLCILLLPPLIQVLFYREFHFRYACALIQAKSCTVRFQLIVNYHFHVVEMIEIMSLFLFFGDTSVVYNLKNTIFTLYAIHFAHRMEKKPLTGTDSKCEKMRTKKKRINVTLLLFYCYFMLN